MHFCIGNLPLGGSGHGLWKQKPIWQWKNATMLKISVSEDCAAVRFILC
jgi:hypothetical protein